MEGSLDVVGDLDVFGFVSYDIDDEFPPNVLFPRPPMASSGPPSSSDERDTTLSPSWAPMDHSEDSSDHFLDSSLDSSTGAEPPVSAATPGPPSSVKFHLRGDLSAIFDDIDKPDDMSLRGDQWWLRTKAVPAGPAHDKSRLQFYVFTRGKQRGKPCKLGDVDGYLINSAGARVPVELTCMDKPGDRICLSAYAPQPMDHGDWLYTVSLCRPVNTLPRCRHPCDKDATYGAYCDKHFVPQCPVPPSEMHWSDVCTVAPHVAAVVADDDTNNVAIAADDDDAVDVVAVALNEHSKRAISSTLASDTKARPHKLRATSTVELNDRVSANASVEFTSACVSK